MTIAPSAALDRLGQLKASFGGQAAQTKLDQLRILERGRLARASAVLRLHECLCFLHAYPDNEHILAQVRLMLDAFDRRR